MEKHPAEIADKQGFEETDCGEESKLRITILEIQSALTKQRVCLYLLIINNQTCGKFHLKRDHN